MSRGDYPWDVKTGFQEVEEGVWQNPRHPEFKVKKCRITGESKYRVWHGDDLVYNSFFLDRAIQYAAEMISDKLNRIKFCGSKE